MKTKGDVCRGFLVRLGVRASCYILIRDKELNLQSEIEKKFNKLHKYLMKFRKQEANGLHEHRTPEKQLCYLL